MTGKLQSMATHVVLLRGINVGTSNRLAMPELREALEAAGFGNVRTIGQSGNVLVDSLDAGATVEAAVAKVIKQSFDLDIPVITRTTSQLAKVVEADPLSDVAKDPKRYQVIFCAGTPTAASLRALSTGDYDDDRLRVVGREVYTWTPDGIHKSKLLRALTERRLGTTGTARNWDTVTKLHAMAQK